MEYTIENLINTSLEYSNTNHDNAMALKYALMAASVSYNPRADVCCCVGEIYLTMGNMDWAEIWFNKALNNTSTWIDEVVPNSIYYTTIPLIKLCFIAYTKGEIEKAKEYNDAVLVIDPKNPTALSNLSLFESHGELNISGSTSDKQHA